MSLLHNKLQTCTPATYETTNVAKITCNLKLGVSPFEWTRIYKLIVPSHGKRFQGCKCQKSTLRNKCSNKKNSLLCKRSLKYSTPTARTTCRGVRNKLKYWTQMLKSELKSCLKSKTRNPKLYFPVKYGNLYHVNCNVRHVEASYDG